MLKKYDGKIGFREFISIILFCIGMRLSDTTAVLYIKSGLNAAWVIPIISASLILIPFLCLLSLLKFYKDKNLIDVIYHLTGNFFGFILVGLLFIIVFEYLIISTRDYADILSTMFYPTTPATFLLFILILCSFYVARKGINVIGSLCLFTYPILQVAVLLVLVMIWNQIHFNYLFPLGGPGIMPLIKESTIYTTTLGEIIVLTIFFPRVRSYKEFRNASLLGLFLSVILISVFLVAYIGAYGYPTLSTINYPYHQLTRLIELGRFARNMESFFLGFWAIGSSVRFAIYLYSAATILAALLKIKTSKTLVPYIAIAVFLIAIIPDNFTKYVLIFRTMGINVFWIYLLILPFLLWGIAKLKGDHQN